MSSLNEAPLDNVVDYVEKKPEEEEPFVFVSRKKNGQRRINSSTTPLPTETKSTFKENKGNMQNSGNELPGWSSKKPGKIKKNSQRAKMLGLREEKTVEWGMSMIEDRIVTLKQSKFYQAFQGSVETSRNSQFQLALGLCLKDILQATGTIYISDPIMTDFDKQLAEKLGITVLQPEDKSKQQIEARTLLYMPHCPKGLYSQVLEANWSRNKLNNLVILGNRFTMYDERAVPEVDTHDREDDPECL
ncbi:hypothetical protein BGZ49_007082 [Haplosporangium sp. Z 27]|nr:hypothetical protein BGZ49_007082 [Haplosporangium sp. Z 27]